MPATAGFGVRYRKLHGTDEAIEAATIAPVPAAYRQGLGRRLIPDPPRLPESVGVAGGLGHPDRREPATDPRGRDDTWLVIHAHETVLDPESSSYAPVAVREIHRLVRSAGGTLQMHPRLSDSQRWNHLPTLDVALVPGLHGSHSIWPEVCTDLGTQALMPRSRPDRTAAESARLLHHALDTALPGRADLDGQIPCTGCSTPTT